VTRQHYFTSVLGWRRREVRKLLRQADRERGDKTVAKIQRAERVRHCRFTIPVCETDPF
jgi:hypothetical protein